MFLVYNPDTYNSNPEINLSGNGQNIPSGSTMPSTSNETDFGNISVGSTTTRVLDIANSGVAPLTVTGITFTGANASEFTVVNAPTFPMTLAQGGSQLITVSFAPAAVGLRRATIRVASNDFDEGTYAAAVQGVGLNTTGIAALTGGGMAKLYPNPTGNAATVDLTLKASERVHLQMLDMQGRIVVAGAEQMLPSGDHKLAINTSNLVNGTYFVQLTVGASVTRMKLVVAH